tara:strand:+ start:1482 stop:2069 length:588 start_codon:yes stop_codon:yes gene_type:complete
MSDSKLRWVKNGFGFIGRKEIHTPEKYAEINREVSANAAAGRKDNNKPQNFIAMAIAAAFEAFEEDDCPPAPTLAQLEGDELLNEFLYLTPDAFAMRPDVSREVLMHLLTIYEHHLEDKRESTRYSFKRFKGGWRTGENKKLAAAAAHANIVSTYQKLRGEGQTDTQAVLSLIERGYGSDSKIRRALRAAKAEPK